MVFLYKLLSAKCNVREFEVKEHMFESSHWGSMHGQNSLKQTVQAGPDFSTVKHSTRT